MTTTLSVRIDTNTKTRLEALARRTARNHRGLPRTAEMAEALTDPELPLVYN